MLKGMAKFSLMLNSRGKSTQNVTVVTKTFRPLGVFRFWNKKDLITEECPFANTASILL